MKRIFKTISLATALIVLCTACSSTSQTNADSAGTRPAAQNASRRDSIDRTVLIETKSVPFNAHFFNPILIGADPQIVLHNGMYYCTTTGGKNLSIIASPTISGMMGAGTTRQKTIFTGGSQNLTQIWAPFLKLHQGFW